LVLPVPGARTGTGVSSTSKLRCHWPGRRRRGHRRAASVLSPWLRPSRTGSKSPGLPHRRRRSQSGDRAVGGRRISDTTIWASSGAPARPRAIWHRRRNHRIAGAAGQFLANVPDEPEPARHCNRASRSPRRRSCATRCRNWHKCTVRDASSPLWAGVPATGAAPASAPRPRLDRHGDHGDAVASRSAWSVSKVSIARSSCSASRATFSEERPNSARR
jgi:hypothetical protein